MKKFDRFHPAGWIVGSLLVAAYILAACRTTTASPGTATARAQRVVAQATDMALQSRQASLLDEKQATATAQERLDRLGQLSNWPVVLSDAFDDNANGWITGTQTSVYADASFIIADGVFHWTATSHQGFTWRNSPTISSVTDFHLAVDSRQISGPAEAYIGLVMRQNDNGDYYLFSVQNTGSYSFDVYDNGQWLSLIPWTPSPAVRVDDLNHVEALAEGESFSFYVNGEWAADYVDQTLSSGYCGLLVGMDAVGEPASWEFDNFELRGLVSAEETPTPEAIAIP